MPDLNDRDYYLHRLTSARLLAARATEPKIAAIHAEMADRYEQLAQQAAEDRRERPHTIQPQLAYR